MGDEFLLYAAVFFKRRVNLFGNAVLARCYHVAYVGSLEAVNVILCRELICRGNEYRAYLHETVGKEPELVMPFENGKHEIALLDAVVEHHIGNAAALLHYVLVGEALFLAVFADPENSYLVGLQSAELIDHVVRKIEIVL